jgi:hypothetical protein
VLPRGLRSGSRGVRRRRAYRELRTLESVAGVRAPAETKRILPAQRFIIVVLATDALGRGQFVVGSPGKQPSFHVFLFDEMAGGNLALSQANFGEHSFLIGDVRLDGIGDQEIRTSARGLGKLREAFLDFRLEADAERATACVRHEHSLSHREPRPGRVLTRGMKQTAPLQKEAERTLCPARPAFDSQLSTSSYVR